MAYLTYKQLSEHLAERGLVVPYHEGPMPHILGEASRREHAHGRGLISVLVVSPDTLMPSTGLLRPRPFHALLTSWLGLASMPDRLPA